MPPPPVIRLHPDDGVVIARATLLPGAPVAPGVAAPMRIPAGHKVAVRPHAVGRADPPLRPDHRLRHRRDRARRARARAQLRHGRFRQGLRLRRGCDADRSIIDPPATFQGIRRPDGRVATRNYIGILTSVNCRRTSRAWSPTRSSATRSPAHDPLADFPNVDGVVALTHKTGCGMTHGRAAGAAAPHARRLRAAREFLRTSSCWASAAR